MAANQQKRDYYEILGLDRSATQEQIKQAYRQLALKWHPDRNPAPDATDRFKEIAEAYAVLSDQTKRKQYDIAGHAGISEHWSTEDLFRDFHFGDFFGSRFGDLGSIFGDLFGGPARRTRAKPKGADLQYDLRLTLDEAAKGGERIIHIARSELCKTCGGNGAKPGTQPVTCTDCQGSGQKQQIKSDRGMRLVTITSCARCMGRGLFIETPCLTCHGTGFELAAHEIKMRVPPGIEDGMMLRLAAQGEAAPEGGTPGDLLVRIGIAPHPTLRREGEDLYTVMPISFPDAALGTKLGVDCLGGETVRISVPPGIQSGTALRARGKGMPRLQGRGKGDLFVVVEVRTPTQLTARQRELLKQFKLEAERARPADFVDEAVET
ncbi:MAG TPA: molecular chaperone DnaJ [Candidatus Binatia bacterium]